MSLYVGSDAGGGYDNYARLVTRHLGRFIPGNPDLIVQNMPGGGGIRVTNNLFNIAAKDGTAIGLVQRAILNMPLLEATQIRVSLRSAEVQMAWQPQHRNRPDHRFERRAAKGDEGPVRAGTAGRQLQSDHGLHAVVPEQRARHEVQDHLRLQKLE